MSAAAARTPFVGGNWKCNQTKDTSAQLAAELAACEEKFNGVDVVISPPTIYLGAALQALEGSAGKVQVAAQNASLTGNGAFTGETSCEMLKDVGINWVVLGHSERRKLYGEDDQVVGGKVKRALEQGLSVIACIGELLEEREAEKTSEVVLRQLGAIADNVSDWLRVVIAYEPVWAIGTNKSASPAQAQEVHAMLRNWIKEKIGDDVSQAVRIIYGGSVKEENASTLFKESDIDGFLVGGASLSAKKFLPIIKATTTQ